MKKNVDVCTVWCLLIITENSILLISHPNFYTDIFISYFLSHHIILYYCIVYPIIHISHFVSFVFQWLYYISRFHYQSTKSVEICLRSSHIYLLLRGDPSALETNHAWGRGKKVHGVATGLKSVIMTWTWTRFLVD